MVTDPIADLLVRIMNAQRVGHDSVKAPFSRLKFDLAKILEKEDFVGKVTSEGAKPKESIVINLKYAADGQPAIQEMKRISKPGQRIYTGSDQIKPIKGGHGMAIISTSQGLMTDKEAKKNSLGGEVMCKIW